MTLHYAVFYIHSDDITISEVYGVYKNRETAIDKLITLANYRSAENGDLTQYMEPTDDYQSMDHIRRIVSETGMLVDHDLYMLQEVYVEDEKKVHDKGDDNNNMKEEVDTSTL